VDRLLSDDILIGFWREIHWLIKWWLLIWLDWSRRGLRISGQRDLIFQEL